MINITSMATQEASDIIQKDVKKKAHKSLVRKSSEKRRTSSLFNLKEEKVLDGNQLRQQIETQRHNIETLAGNDGWLNLDMVLHDKASRQSTNGA